MLGNWDVPSARCSLPVAVFGAVLSVAVVCGRRRLQRVRPARCEPDDLRSIAVVVALTLHHRCLDGIWSATDDDNLSVKVP